MGLPVVISALYFGLMASDVYISFCKFSVRSAGQTKASTLGELFSSAVSGTHAGDSELVREFILSRAMLNKLQEELLLKSLYSKPTVDFVSRLKKDCTDEEFFDYFKSMVNVRVDAPSGVSNLEIRAFSPQDSQLIANHILENAEFFVNRLSHRIQHDAVAFSKKEVEEAEGYVSQANNGLWSLQRKYHYLDPSQSTGGILSLIQELYSKLIGAKIEFQQAKAYMRENSSDFLAIKNKINAINQQINAHEKLLIGESKRSLAEILQEFEELSLKKHLAQEKLKVALAGLDLARNDAQRKSKYLLRVVEPSYPDEALEPNFWLKISTVFGVCIVGYAVIGLLISAIKEHQF